MLTRINILYPDGGQVAVDHDGDMIRLMWLKNGQVQDGFTIWVDLLAQLASQDLVQTSSWPLVRLREHPAWGEAVLLVFKSGHTVVDTAELASAAGIEL